jgi:hypothetical protein
MLNLPLRFFLYIVIGVAASISLLADPDLHAASRIVELFQSLVTLSQNAFSALR